MDNAKTAKIIVDSRARLAPSDLPGEALEELKDAFVHENPHRKSLQRMGIAGWWDEPKEYVNWSEDSDGGVSFPRGGLARIREVLGRHGLRPAFVDRRERGADVDPADALVHGVQLWDFQQEVVEAMIAKENCILRAPTASGKGTMGLALAAAVGCPTLAIVWNKNLFVQWVERACAEFGLGSRDVGIIKGKTRRLRPITVAMQQTLSAHGIDDELNAYFGCVMLDEVQRSAASSVRAAIDPWRARYRFGLSADHRRKDAKEFLIYDLFGEVVRDIKQADLVRGGFVREVEIRVIPTEFRADWYGMPLSGEEDKELDFVRLIAEMCADPARNELVVAAALEYAADGEQALVLSHRREHCIFLAASVAQHGVQSGYSLGGEDLGGRTGSAANLASFRAGDVRVLAGTYQALGTGVDLPKVARGVCATPVAGNRQLLVQAKGRLARRGSGDKSQPVLAYLWDRLVFGEKHLLNLVRTSPRVVVLSDLGEWVDGREYLRGMARAREGAAE